MYQNIDLLEQALQFFVDRGLDSAILLADKDITKMSDAYLFMLGQLGIVLDQEQKMHWFRMTWYNRDLKKYLILNYRLTSIDNNLLKFFLEKLRSNRQWEGMEYLDLLIEANCIRFIPDINLYPPDKQEKVLAFTNSRAYSEQLSFLPNELLFKIFSEM